MKTIEEIMNRVPDTPVYHYTSQNGLLGIIRTKSIWATCIHYLNDSEEFLYAIKLARTMITHELDCCVGEKEKNLLLEMERLLSSYERVNIFVSSFSENGDLLSQWRGYCSHSSGFSLGYDYGKLQPLLTKQGFIFAPCIYDSQIQSLILRELIESTFDLFMKLMEEEPNEETYNLNRACQTFISWLVLQAAIIKHPDFSEEREWRMLSHPMEIQHPQVYFREGISMIVPYFNFRLEDEENDFPLFEIIVGPTPHKELAQRATNMIIQAQRLEQIAIRSSTIPFRGW